MSELVDASVKILSSGISYALKVPTDSTIHDLQCELEKQLDKPDSFCVCDEYSLFEHTEKVVHNTSFPLSPGKLLITLPRPILLAYDKSKILVTIRNEKDNQEQTHLFDTQMTVARVIKEISPTDYRSCELRLITFRSKKGGNTGVRLNPHRSLRSYRLREGDILVFGVAISNSGIWRNVGGKEQVAVIVSIPAPYNLSKALKVSPSIKFKDLTSLFLQKIYLTVAPSLYGIFVSLDGSKNQDMVGSNMQLNSVPLPTPIRLTCKFIPQSKQKLFGVNPSSLAMVDDGGIIVPRVLVVLKELLLINNGFKVEGLFRRAGSESMMKTIRENLENGDDVSTKDVHSVATLIKRWFKELPNRILLDTNTFTISSIMEEKSKKTCLQKLLPPLQARLLTWVFDLCVTLIENYSSTKMDAKNLGIVWGPALVAEAAQIQFGSDGRPNASVDLQTTANGVDIVQTNLCYLVDNHISPLAQLSDALPGGTVSSTLSNRNRFLSESEIRLPIKSTEVLTPSGWKNAVKRQSVKPFIPLKRPTGPPPRPFSPSQQSRTFSNAHAFVPPSPTPPVRLKRSGTTTELPRRPSPAPLRAVPMIPARKRSNVGAAEPVQTTRRGAATPIGSSQFMRSKAPM